MHNPLSDISFPPSVLAPYFRWGTNFFTPDTIESTLALPADGNRIYAAFIVTTGVVTINPGGPVFPSQAINVGNSLQIFEVKFKDVGTLCGVEWWASSAPAGQTMFVMWSRYEPHGQSVSLGEY